MSTWQCSSCGRKACVQLAGGRPYCCLDPDIRHNQPVWRWVSESEGADSCIPVVSSDSFESRVKAELKAIGDLLVEKNRKYGNAALDPVRVFAKSDKAEQIRVRIDDKLNRIKNRQNDEDEDVINDLIGYLILYKLALEGSDGDINK